MSTCVSRPLPARLAACRAARRRGAQAAVAAVRPRHHLARPRLVRPPAAAALVRLAHQPPATRRLQQLPQRTRCRLQPVHHRPPRHRHALTTPHHTQPHPASALFRHRAGRVWCSPRRSPRRRCAAPTRATAAPRAKLAMAATRRVWRAAVRASVPAHPSPSPSRSPAARARARAHPRPRPRPEPLRAPCHPRASHGTAVGVRANRGADPWCVALRPNGLSDPSGCCWRPEQLEQMISEHLSHSTAACGRGRAAGGPSPIHNGSTTDPGPRLLSCFHGLYRSLSVHAPSHLADCGAGGERYNEVILDIRALTRHLPISIEAFFYHASCTARSERSAVAHLDVRRAPWAESSLRAHRT